MHKKENFKMISQDGESASGLLAYLYRDGLLDKEMLQKIAPVLAEQSLTHYLVKNNFLSSELLLHYCAKKFGLPIYDLKDQPLNWQDDPLINPELICRYRVIPLELNHTTLTVGITDPTAHSILRALSFHTGFRIRPMLVAEEELDKIITAYFHPHQFISRIATTLSKMTPLQDPFIEINTKEEDEPIIQFVDQLMQDAITKSASDIHIEPYEQNSRIRFRLDGLLYETATIPQHLAERVITRLKIMANLNIAERRLPQDGRIQLHSDSFLYPTKELGKNVKIDIRVNTCPTVFGEKIVLRLLDNKNIYLEIDALGMDSQQKNLFLSKLTQPQGLILVTGPTGSGKTLTLYSALNYLNHAEKNISSVEDPVEIELFGINQVNVNPRIGLDFATILRTFLRQDPDVIMIGEIRDKITAEIALQAAQTGHLVLSTLHTNSAIEAIPRFKSLGLETYHLLHSLSLIIAQRLLRKLCSHCKEVDKNDWGNSTSNSLYRPRGCDQCHQGYYGRTGVFELIPVTESLKMLILSGAGEYEIARFVQQEEIKFLHASGLEKVYQGITSMNEFIRVLGSLPKSTGNKCSHS